MSTTRSASRPAGQPSLALPPNVPLLLTLCNVPAATDARVFSLSRSGNSLPRNFAHAAASTGGGAMA